MTKPGTCCFAMIGALFVFCVFGSETLVAGTVYVGKCPGSGTPTYPTIQTAVIASSPGGTVKICPGTYPEQVTINKNLTVMGFQSGTADDVLITGTAAANTVDLYNAQPIAAQVLVQNAANVNLSNITVDGSANQSNGCASVLVGIYYQNASGAITAVVTRNQLGSGQEGCQGGLGIFVQSGYGTGGTANVTIQNNSVHSFQKNGITVDGNGASGNITNNYISGQGSTTGAAENGIQISDGAAGYIASNVVSDVIYAPASTGSSGILVYASQNITVQNNTVSTTQLGIVTVTDSTSQMPNNPMGLADHTTIKNNQVLNTQNYDAIEVCSNENTIQSNTLFNSAQSAIHLDAGCGSSGKNNHVSNNTINEACAGILQSGTPNTITGNNDFYNVVTTMMSGDFCPAPTTTASISFNAPISQTGNGSAHPVPFR